jgi:hypothetical protein
MESTLAMNPAYQAACDDVMRVGSEIARMQETLQRDLPSPAHVTRMQGEVIRGLGHLRTVCDAFERTFGNDAASRLRRHGPPRDMFWEHSGSDGACYGFTGDPRLPATLAEYRALTESVEADANDRKPRSGRPPKFRISHQPTQPTDPVWQGLYHDVLLYARLRYTASSIEWRRFVIGFRARVEGRSPERSDAAWMAGYRSASELYLRESAGLNDWATPAQRAYIARRAESGGARGIPQVKALRVARVGVRLDEIDTSGQVAASTVVFEDGAIGPWPEGAGDAEAEVLEVISPAPVAGVVRRRWIRPAAAARAEQLCLF